MADPGDRLRILWVSNAPWGGTGYAEQTALFVPLLVEAGHEVAVVANFGLEGTTLDWNGIKVYPSDHAWGNDTIATFADDWKADQVICLCDAWVLNPEQIGRDIAVWAPVDHNPVPPKVGLVLAHPNVTPIAMSRFGRDEMTRAKLKPLYVPHGVDTGFFKPRPEVRDELREHMKIPQDAFVVGMVAANKASGAIHRKAFPQAFLAFSRFAAKHPDAYMYCHTQASPGYGFHLDILADACKVPEGRLRFTSEKAWKLGVKKDFVAYLYNIFDVLLSPSMGEGFGIPILEAQACGVPVITSDHSAMTELTESGWLVTGDPFWDEASKAWFHMPSVDSIEDWLGDAHRAVKAGDRSYSDAAVEFAQGYDAGLVLERDWKPALEELGRPKDSGVIVMPNREQRRKLERAR